MSCGGGPPSSACSPIIPLLASFTSEESDGRRCFTGTQNSARLSYPCSSSHRTGHLNLFSFCFFFFLLLSLSSFVWIVCVVQPQVTSGVVVVVVVACVVFRQLLHHSTFLHTISRNHAQLNWFRGLRSGTQESSGSLCHCVHPLTLAQNGTPQSIAR